MKDKKADFDLSKLSLKELIKVYEDIDLFQKFLKENKTLIVGDEKNE